MASHPGRAELSSRAANELRKRRRYRRGVIRALALAAAVLALAAAAAAGAAAPAQQSLATAAPVTLLAADGMRAAAVVPGDSRVRCTSIVLWRPGERPVTVRTQVGCGRGGLLEGLTEVALGGSRVLWQETNGGNNLELLVKTATVANPNPKDVSYVANGNGAGGYPAGDWTGGLHADGSLLVFARWSHCEQAEGGSTYRPCVAGQPDVYDGALHRVVGGRDTVLRRGDDLTDPVWVDGGRTLVRRPDGTLALLRESGATLRTFDAGPGTTDAVFQGSRLAVLRATALDVYDTASGERLEQFHLSRMPRRLVDVQSGIAVLLSTGQIHLLRLDTGRGATIVPPRGGGPLLVQLEPQGLFYSAGARVFFEPFADVLRGFR